jgi:hypothetical protein
MTRQSRAISYAVLRAVASMYSWGGGGGGGVGPKFPNDENNFRIFHDIRRCLLSGK